LKLVAAWPLTGEMVQADVASLAKLAQAAEQGCATTFLLVFSETLRSIPWGIIDT